MRWVLDQCANTDPIHVPISYSKLLVVWLRMCRVTVILCAVISAGWDWASSYNTVCPAFCTWIVCLWTVWSIALPHTHASLDWVFVEYSLIEASFVSVSSYSAATCWATTANRYKCLPQGECVCAVCVELLLIVGGPLIITFLPRKLPNHRVECTVQWFCTPVYCLCLQARGSLLIYLLYEEVSMFVCMCQYACVYACMYACTSMHACMQVSTITWCFP